MNNRHYPRYEYDVDMDKYAYGKGRLFKIRQVWVEKNREREIRNTIDIGEKEFEIIIKKFNEIKEEWQMKKQYMIN